MILQTWEKQPYEIEPRTIDFTRRLETGETIASATVTAKDADTGADASSILLGPVAVDAAGFVTRLIQGGISGTRYVVEFKAITSLGYQIEDEWGVLVKET